MSESLSLPRSSPHRVPFNILLNSDQAEIHGALMAEPKFSLFYPTEQSLLSKLILLNEISGYVCNHLREETKGGSD